MNKWILEASTCVSPPLWSFPCLASPNPRWNLLIRPPFYYSTLYLHLHYSTYPTVIAALYFDQDDNKNNVTILSWKFWLRHPEAIRKKFQTEMCHPKMEISMSFVTLENKQTNPRTWWIWKDQESGDKESFERRISFESVPLWVLRVHQEERGGCFYLHPEPRKGGTSTLWRWCLWQLGRHDSFCGLAWKW